MRIFSSTSYGAAMFKGHMFVISGPSAVGKDVTLNVVRDMDEFKALDFVEPKSYTTKSPRGDESDMNYVFVTDEQFDELERTELLESTVSHGHRYGMHRESFENALGDGHNVIKLLDTNGAAFLKRKYPDDVTTIYMKPPSVEELRRRLVSRGKETPAEIERRMSDSITEMRTFVDYDFMLTNVVIGHSARIVMDIISCTLDEKTRDMSK